LVCKTYHLAKRNLSFRRPKQVELQHRFKTQQRNNNKINTKQAIKSTKSDVLKTNVTIALRCFSAYYRQNDVFFENHNFLHHKASHMDFILKTVFCDSAKILEFYRCHTFIYVEKKVTAT
jgi:phosphomevalonate kinase